MFVIPLLMIRTQSYKSIEMVTKKARHKLSRTISLWSEMPASEETEPLFIVQEMGDGMTLTTASPTRRSATSFETCSLTSTSRVPSRKLLVSTSQKPWNNKNHNRFDLFLLCFSFVVVVVQQHNHHGRTTRRATTAEKHQDRGQQ